ncbi:UNKNOWN [Stylonychia lemnae]|uniref:Uncharacterized protein n=1 Tax=Stylonychia lemnae TaxID=5949 RepID=A0A078B0Z4_STYLE|nr:UNKNOWN [Stylonychia lemnae]|eukprot:CDW86763.1 UNKNOWN [Stylonychia lemnae]
MEIKSKSRAKFILALLSILTLNTNTFVAAEQNQWVNLIYQAMLSNPYKGTQKVSLAQSATDLEELFIKGRFEVEGALQIGMWDEPSYSYEIYQGDVHDAKIQAELYLELKFDIVLLNFYNIKTTHKLDLARAGLGYEHYISYENIESCGLFYYNAELVTIHNRLTTNIKTCKLDSDVMMHPTPRAIWNKMKCQYDPDFKSNADLQEFKTWTPLPQYYYKEYPLSGCTF